MTSSNIGTPHAFTTRIGGVSGGVFASLNLSAGVGDDFAAVRENYAILRRALGMTAGIFTCSKQVHGANIRIAEKEERGEPPPPPDIGADGMITCETGLALMVFTADCVPILLHDPVRGAIGAVHAGWRGTTAGIAIAAVRAMADAFGCVPVDIRAAIGPCISKCCYETDSDVADALRAQLGATAERCIERRGSKYMIDLKEANRILLEHAGLRDIEVSDECTSCLSDKYWSHRKTNGLRGSQAAIIELR